MRWMRTALALSTLTVVVACGDDSGTGVLTGNDAIVQGRVEETTAIPSSMSAAPAASGAPAMSARTVAVGELDSGGTFGALAQGTVEADGSFRVEGLPADRDDLVVVAYDDAGADVGRVMLYERTRAGMVVTAAPITTETTLRARTWARLKAENRTDASSPEEVELLLHPGAGASATVIANGEVGAAAMGVATAGEAMTRAFAQMGATLTASTRASLIAEAAAAYASARFNGSAEEDAVADFMNAALDAWVAAGADLGVTAAATACAASTFDAQLEGHTSARGPIVSDVILLNLEARRRLAAQFVGSAEGSIAVTIRDALASTEEQMSGSASTAVEVRAMLDAGTEAVTQATVSAMLDLLVPGAGVVLRNDVQAKAEAAVAAARLDTRLSAAANADAAAQAVADYHSAVFAAVQAMLETAGRTDLDAEAMTSLYIAAYGGAFVRAA